MLYWFFLHKYLAHIILDLFTYFCFRCYYKSCFKFYFLLFLLLVCNDISMLNLYFSFLLYSLNSNSLQTIWAFYVHRASFLKNDIFSFSHLYCLTLLIVLIMNSSTLLNISNDGMHLCHLLLHFLLIIMIYMNFYLILYHCFLLIPNVLFYLLSLLSCFLRAICHSPFIY